MTWHTCIVEVKDPVKCPFHCDFVLCSLLDDCCDKLEGRCPLKEKAFVIFKA